MAVQIGLNEVLPYDPACDWTRLITYRPAEGAQVDLNPPRFSWPYLPDVFPGEQDELRPYDTGATGYSLAKRLFTFEIASRDDFAADAIVFRKERTPFNFYNALPLFAEGRPYYWRVAYLTDEGTFLQWSAVRTFSVKAGAQKWDRTVHDEAACPPRPRVLGGAGPASLRTSLETSEDARGVGRSVEAVAGVTSKKWWVDLPAHDRFTRDAFCAACPDAPGHDFTGITELLAKLALHRLLSGKGDLAEVAARAAVIAAYPIGGLSGPESAPGSLGADVAQIPEFLAVVYDLCHSTARPEDLAKLREGIAWRVRFTYENFGVYGEDGARVPYNSMLVSPSSHPFEASMGVLGAAALMQGDPDLTQEQRDIFEQAYAFGVHWLSGCTNGFGSEDSWSEGPGYGNSKMQWLVNAVCYYDLARPVLKMGCNPALKAIGDFFIHTSPLGHRAVPFGNGCAKYDYVVRNRMTAAFCLAYLLKDGTFRRTWTQSAEALVAAGLPEMAEIKKFWRPWICLGLAMRDEPPCEEDAPSGVRLFSNGGWLTAATESPNRFDRFASSTGMVVQARPVGGYQHAFFSDGSPQLWAFGELINFGSGTTANKEPFAYSPMSTNTVLVNGVGQRQLCHWHRDHFQKRRVPKQSARFAAFKQGSGQDVYALADLTNGYGSFAGPAGHWWGDLNGPYQGGPLPKVTQALRHMLFVRGRYFVMLDDYKLAADEQPAAFSWLWHVLQESAIEQLGPGHLRYKAGEVRVDLAHLHEADDLVLENRTGLSGALNPLTGEDYRESVQGVLDRSSNEALLMAHNFWFTGKQRTRARRFLTVVYPSLMEEAPPQIETLGALRFRVNGPHGSDLFDFSGREDGADYRIDADALAGAAVAEQLRGAGDTDVPGGRTHA